MSCDHEKSSHLSGILCCVDREEPRTVSQFVPNMFNVLPFTAKPFNKVQAFLYMCIMISTVL